MNRERYCVPYLGGGWVGGLILCWCVWHPHICCVCVWGGLSLRWHSFFALDILLETYTRKEAPKRVQKRVAGVSRPLWAQPVLVPSLQLGWKCPFPIFLYPKL